MPPAEESSVLVEGPWRHRDVTRLRAALPRRRARTGRRAARPAAARLPGVLVVLAPPARGARRRRLPRRRTGPARLRRDRQATPRVRRLHAVRRRRRPGPGARAPRRARHGTRLGRVARLERRPPCTPSVVNRLSVLSCPHPLRLRARRSASDRAQLRMSSLHGRASSSRSCPRSACRKAISSPSCSAAGAARASRTTRRAQRCREAMTHPVDGALRAGVLPLVVPLADPAERPALPPAAGRGGPRAGAAAARRARRLHPRREPRTGPARWAHAGYELEVLDGLGHFPHQEAPDLVTELLLEHARA